MKQSFTVEFDHQYAEAITEKDVREAFTVYQLPYGYAEGVYEVAVKETTPKPPPPDLKLGVEFTYPITGGKFYGKQFGDRFYVTELGRNGIFDHPIAFVEAQFACGAWKVDPKWSNV